MPVAQSHMGMAHRRNPWLQPFASNSTWNIGIGSGATWTTTADAETAQLVAMGGFINTNGNFNMPYYLGRASDPLITVSCSDTIGVIPNQQIRIPLGATPAGGSDKHMTLFDATQPTKMFSYYNCVISNAIAGGVGATSTIATSLGGIWDLTGAGVFPFGWTRMPRNFEDGKDNYGIGVIRDWEITAGVIKHALRYAMPGPKSTWNTGVAWAPNTVYVPGQDRVNSGSNVYRCLTGGTSAASGGPTGTGTDITDGTVHWIFMNPVGYFDVNMPWPSAHQDYCGGPTAVTFCGTQDYTGIIKWNHTIGIPSTVNVGSLGLSAAGLMLAKCIQTYGMYQRDTSGGGNNIILYTENVSGPNTAAVTAMSTDFNTIIVPQLRIMTNQTTDLGATNLNGGGTYPPLIQPVDIARMV